MCVAHSSSHFIALKGHIGFTGDEGTSLFITVRGGTSLGGASRKTYICCPGDKCGRRIKDRKGVTTTDVRGRLITLKLGGGKVLCQGSTIKSHCPSGSGTSCCTIVGQDGCTNFPKLVIRRTCIDGRSSDAAFLGNGSQLGHLNITSTANVTRCFSLVLSRTPILRAPIMGTSRSIALT